MSGNNNVAHQVLDQLSKFKLKYSGKLEEIAKKHNDLAAQLVAMETTINNIMAFTATELGKIQGIMEGEHLKNDRVHYKMDVNILALAEIQKTLFEQTSLALAFMEKANLTLSDEEKESCREVAAQCRKDITSAAFSLVQKRMDEEEIKFQEKEEEARKASADQEEKANIERELQKDSLTEKSISNFHTGGPGSEFPDGADFFGSD